MSSEENWLAVGAEHRFHRGADLVQSAVGAGAIENKRHEIPRRCRRFAQRAQLFLDECVVPLGPHLRHPLPLLSFRLLGDFEKLDLDRGPVRYEFVHADDYAPMLLDLPLLAGRGLIDLALKPSSLEAANYSANFLDLLEQHLRFPFQFRGKSFDVIRAAKRIDDIGDSALERKNLLGPERDLYRFLGWERERFVHGIRVQRLGSTEHGGHCLVGDANDVVHGLLRGQRHARGLGMEAHHERARILRTVTILHMPSPDTACGAKLCYFLEEIVVDVPEEGESWCKRIDVEAPRDASLHVSESIRQREGQLLSRCSTGFPDVVAGNRYRVPLRDVLG